MNELIEQIFADFEVDGVQIPVAFLTYDGHRQTYVSYQMVDMDNSLSADNELVGFAEYYDFDVFSKGNYNKIIERIKELLTEQGFVWQPGKSSGDLYEVETGYYHRTLNFGILREV